MNTHAIGWVGLGRMGEPMARRLAEAGFRLAAWNRSPDKATEFARSCGEDVTACASPRELAETSGRIVLMLASPKALEAVLAGPDGLLAGLQPGTLVVDMGTDGVEAVVSLDRRVRERGASVLDAPVLGSRGPAEKGALIVMAGGAPADLERARDLLAPLARSVERTGEVGSGQAMKLAANLMLAHMITGLAGAIGLARAQGIDAGALVAILEAGLGSPYFRTKGLQMIRDEVAPQFTLALMRKDLSLIAEAAGKVGLDWPTLEPIQALADEASRQGWDELDGACIVRLARARAARPRVAGADAAGQDPGAG